jgi:hypothetical protein
MQDAHSSADPLITYFARIIAVREQLSIAASSFAVIFPEGA